MTFLQSGKTYQLKKSPRFGRATFLQFLREEYVRYRTKYPLIRLGDLAEGKQVARVVRFCPDFPASQTTEPKKVLLSATGQARSEKEKGS